MRRRVLSMINLTKKMVSDIYLIQTSRFESIKYISMKVKKNFISMVVQVYADLALMKTNALDKQRFFVTQGAFYLLAGFLHECAQEKIDNFHQVAKRRILLSVSRNLARRLSSRPMDAPFWIRQSLGHGRPKKMFSLKTANSQVL